MLQACLLHYLMEGENNMNPTPMETLMTSVGAVVTAGITWMGQFATAIAAHDILVLGVVAVPLVGLGAGLLGRLLKKRV